MLKMKIRNSAIMQFKGLIVIAFLQIMALAFNTSQLLLALILNYVPEAKPTILFHCMRVFLDYTVFILITLLGISFYRHQGKFKVFQIRVFFILGGAILGFLFLFTILWLFFHLGTFYQTYILSFILGVALLRLKKWAIIPSIFLCPIILGELFALLYITSIIALPDQLIKHFPVPLVYYGYIKMVITSFFYVIYINYFTHSRILEFFQFRVPFKLIENEKILSLSRKVLFVFFLILTIGWFKNNPVNNGVRKAYYDNGNLKYGISYRQGKRHEKTQEFFSNGQLKLEWIYQNGKLNGISKEYYESGELYREHEYFNNIRIGLKVFYKNGHLKGEYQFKNDKQDGLAREYYENGMLKNEGNFIQNSCFDCREYYETGELKQTLNYKDIKEDGPFKEYYRNGKLKAEGQYENGERIVIRQYDENGKGSGDGKGSVNSR